MTSVQGVFLPIITPFHDGTVDVETYTSLVEHYVSTGISGIIPLGTTGESPVISATETREIIERTLDVVNQRIPVFVGVGGNCTADVVARSKEMAAIGVDGILSVCPYYNRPGQDGIYQHYKAVSDATDLPVIMYNIPGRTGVNMTNETILRLAGLETIVGIKDSCGDIAQTLELLSQKPEGFSVLTGEDLLFFINGVNGGDGGILASSHLHTRKFVQVYERLKDNDHHGARDVWRCLEDLIPLLFREANPGPVKYCLYRAGMIPSPEMRLPMTDISAALKQRLDDVALI